MLHSPGVAGAAELGAVYSPGVAGAAELGAVHSPGAGDYDQVSSRIRATRSWPKAVRMARYIKPVAAITAE